jgi:uncharacterized peroxidase-related enzyme
MQQPLVLPASPTNDKNFDDLVKLYEETLGFCPNSVKTMYHRPEIAYAFIALNRAVMQNSGKVTSVLKRLVGYISSNAAGCRYCQAHTIRAAERYGATDHQLQHIWEYATHDAFNEAERAALDFALAASAQPSGVDDAIATRLRAYFNEGEIVELAGVVALFGFLNRWNDGMGTAIEDGAVESGVLLLQQKGWEANRHQY